MIHPQQHVVLGPPGTGKTSTLLRIVEEALQAGIKPQKIGYFSFTKKATEEAISRARARFGFSERQLMYFRTIDSMAFRQTSMRREQVVQWSHYRELGQHLGMEFKGRANADDGTTYGMGKPDRMLFVEGLARARQQPLHEAWSVANEPDIAWFELERLAESLKLFKRKKGLLDFTDILEAFVNNPKALVPDLDLLIVDEAQDLSIIRWKAIAKVAACSKAVYIAGDDDQCSVDGTKVLTTVGRVAVEALNPKKHRLVSYDREASVLAGFRKGYAFEIKPTKHHGPIVTVSAGASSTSTTLNHKWIVKWTDAAKQSGVCVTYLMRKGLRWRVGWCQLFRADGCLHLGVRARLERAEEAWVLGVHPSRTAASVEESVVAATFGLPTVTFEPVNGANHLTAEAITAVFDGVGALCDKAVACLRSFGRAAAFPLWSDCEAHTRRAGSQVFETRASNLLSGIMAVPVQQDNGKRTKWETAIISRSVRECTVWGLNVEGHHNYVADGIVTHNCIYRWAGADVDSFMGLQGAGTSETLGQSHRIPLSVHNVASRIIGRVKNRTAKDWLPRKELGAVNQVNSPHMVDLAAAPGWKEYRAEHPEAYEWLLLARNGYMLEDLEKLCRQQGYSYESVGKNPLTSPVLKAIVSWEKMRGAGPKGPQPISKAEAENVLKFISPARIPQAIRDVLKDTNQRGSVVLNRPDSPIWHQALDRIDAEDREFFIAARKRGETLTGKPRIRISTIHTAKGGEADNVLLLSDMSQRTYNEMNRDMDSECRVWYVAVTRARKALHVVNPINVSLAFPVV